MAYAPGAPREAAANDTETLKSTRDTLDPPKPRAAKAVATTGSENVRPLKAGPISVFVSRKEGKLFVRKGFDPVFDVPVTFERRETRDDGVPAPDVRIYSTGSSRAGATSCALRSRSCAMPRSSSQPCPVTTRGVVLASS